MSVSLITILGDSWTRKGNFKKSIVDGNPREYIDIRPHGTVADVPCASLTERITAAEGAFVNFLSEGGYTLKKYLLDTDRQGEWARDVKKKYPLFLSFCLSDQRTSSSLLILIKLIHLIELRGCSIVINFSYGLLPFYL